jgi:hypothetical protein
MVRRADSTRQAEPPASDASAARTRALALLAVTSAIGGSGLATGGTAGALLSAQLAGTNAAAGLRLGLLVLGSAASARLISRQTSRVGRGSSLALGYAAGAAGALLVVLAAVTTSLTTLLGGSLLLAAVVVVAQPARRPVEGMRAGDFGRVPRARQRRAPAAHDPRGQLGDTIPSKRDETRGKNDVPPRRRSGLSAGRKRPRPRSYGLLAMQKVVGSSPISRLEVPANRNLFRTRCCLHTTQKAQGSSSAGTSP